MPGKKFPEDESEDGEGEGSKGGSGGVYAGCGPAAPDVVVASFSLALFFVFGDEGGGYGGAAGQHVLSIIGKEPVAGLRDADGHDVVFLFVDSIEDGASCQPPSPCR